MKTSDKQSQKEKRSSKTDEPKARKTHHPAPTAQDGKAKSTPTLGTLVMTPQPEQQQHQTPFQSSDNKQGVTKDNNPLQPAGTKTAGSEPSFGPAPRPFSSITSSIRTGTTPLTTTPGGTSAPIKLSLSGLAAAAAAEKASIKVDTSIASPVPTNTVGASFQTLTPGQTDQALAASAPTSESPLTSGPPTKTLDQYTTELKQQPITNVAPSPHGTSASGRRGGGGGSGGIHHQAKSTIAGHYSKIRISKASASRIRDGTQETSWGYYLFLGIFLLVLLILIVTLAVTKSRT